MWDIFKVYNYENLGREDDLEKGTTEFWIKLILVGLWKKEKNGICVYWNMTAVVWLLETKFWIINAKRFSTNMPNKKGWNIYIYYRRYFNNFILSNVISLQRWDSIET